MTGRISDAARELDAAALAGRSVPMLSAAGALGVDEAYAIQAEAAQLRLGRGERRVGIKMGFTSRAKMIQMGVSDMIWGRLTDAMAAEDGGTIAHARFIHPRAEPEIAFLLHRPLEGAVGMAEAWAAVEAVAPSIEVIDSRYRDFKFSLEDVVADNASAAAFVIGPPCVPADVGNLGMTFRRNGRVVSTGSSAAILGHPLRSLVAAARLVAERGEHLPAGSIVLAGAACEAVAVAAGDRVSVEFTGLGRAELGFDGGAA